MADFDLKRRVEVLESRVWSLMDLRDLTAMLTDIPTITSEPYAKLSHTLPNGTAGGTFTSGAWQTRTLNTEDVDDDAIVSLAANQFTLAAGTYRFAITAPAYRVGRHKAILYNVTDVATSLIGTQSYTNTTADYAADHSKIVGQLTIAGAKVFEVRHRCETTKATNGFGIDSNIGVDEVFTVVEIWKEF